MKLYKLFVFILLVLIMFFLTACNSNTKDLAEQLYGTKNVSSATLQSLKDPNYQNNIITDSKLKEELEKGFSGFVYFFSPTCSFCKQTTPVLLPVAKDFNATIHMYNIYEYRNGWEDFGITGTPTLVYYEDSQELIRLNGAVPKEAFTEFFGEYSKDKFKSYILSHLEEVVTP